MVEDECEDAKVLSKKSSPTIKASNFIGKTNGRLSSQYTVGKIIGEGAFGTVRLCTHR